MATTTPRTASPTTWPTIRPEFDGPSTSWPAVPLSSAAEEVLRARYLRNGETTGTEVFKRTARAIAQGEAEYGNNPEEWARRFYQELFHPLLFVPNSPTLANAGTEEGCLSACFVISPQDDMGHIGETLKEWMLTEKWGGGIGAFFGHLRQQGAEIHTIHGSAFGPVGAMEFFAATAGRVTQGSFRPGAHMAQIQISHPDIRRFIHCKDDARRFEALKSVAEREGWGDLVPKLLAHPLANFNISVQVPDAFMGCVEQGKQWALVAPHTGETIELVDARELWNELCDSAWRTGDPGIVFIDRVAETAPNPQLGPIESSNPCGEEFLPQYGSCNLGSVDLSKHLTPGGRFDWPKLRHTVHLAVRFLDDVITINRFPMEAQRAINLAERRIGLGVMGWADALMMLGIPYDSDEAVALGDEAARKFRNYSWEASALLAQDRGPFPAWEASALRTRFEAHQDGLDGVLGPVRNANVMTIAPTGSISIFSGCSSGIEPPYAAVWRRRSLWTSATESKAVFVECPRVVRQTLVDAMGEEAAEKLLWEALDVEDPIVDAEPFLKEHAPTLDLRALRSAHNIAPEWHVRHQAAWQRWVTNSVSKTINLPEQAAVADVDAAFKLAWREGVKATTAYRHNSRAFQVLDVGGKRETEKGDRHYLTTSRPRPRQLEGRTMSVHTGDGHVYVTVNHDEQGSPFEVFANVGKAGTDAAAYTEAIGRLLSLHFRRNGSVDEVLGQLRGITGSQPMWDDGRKVLSVPDAIGIALGEIMGGDRASAAATLARLQTVKNPEVHEALEALNGPARVAGTRFLCKVCGGVDSRPEGGCEVCVSCGWSKCE